MTALRKHGRQTSGRLHRALFEDDEVSRNDFEDLVSALARAGLVWLVEDSFDKAGNVIRFRWVELTPEGLRHEGSLEGVVTLPAPLPKKKAAKKKKESRKAATRAGRSKTAAGSVKAVEPDDTLPDEALLKALKDWRLQEARRRRIPAFRVLHDVVLVEIARLKPRSQGDLLAIHGFGPTLAAKYGLKLLALVTESDSPKT